MAGICLNIARVAIKICSLLVKLGAATKKKYFDFKSSAKRKRPRTHWCWASVGGRHESLKRKYFHLFNRVSLSNSPVSGGINQSNELCGTCVNKHVVGFLRVEWFNVSISPTALRSLVWPRCHPPNDTFKSSIVLTKNVPTTELEKTCDWRVVKHSGACEHAGSKCVALVSTEPVVKEKRRKKNTVDSSDLGPG